MYKVEAVIKNETGLHARPASVFIKEASKYKSDIIASKDGKEYVAKSILGILSMSAAKGEVITISAEGSDEEKAVTALVALIESGFGEL